MPAMVTVASGQPGQSLLMRKNHHELIACNLDQLEVTYIEKPKTILDESKPDVVINLAAYTNIDKTEAEMDLAFAVNATAAKNIAQLTNQKIPFIHLPTDYFFLAIKDRSIWKLISLILLMCTVKVNWLVR